MTARTILWMDLRTSFSGPDLCSSLPRSYNARRLCHLPDLFWAVQDWRPWAICFEYDVPDARGLAALAEVKDRNSLVPTFLLTERQAKTTAALAFRRQVWDYLVKPVSARRFCERLKRMEIHARQAEATAQARSAVGGAQQKPQPPVTLAPAVSYISANYPDKLQQATAAKLCDLSPFQFSRVFKKEYGITFRDYVVKIRIDRAAELIKQSRVSVTDAAFVVGFNDLSYFARMFRRQLGVSPSCYRSVIEPNQFSLFPLEETRRR
jgi:AraC-like DNA-binding protein